MKDLKIKIGSEAESKEAQELFFELGAKWRSQINREEAAYVINTEYPSIILHGGDMSLNWNTIEQFNSLSYYKEITLQELRDMVNPMKEYLEKQADGSYKLVMRGIVGRDDDIEVPEGANIYWKDGDEHWFTTRVMGYRNSIIVWQRPTQLEALPFIDDNPQSLNDQYAEIEQVRKQSIEATLAERQAQYGCFEDVAFVTENIMATLSKVRSNGLTDLPHTHRMALYMIASKMARIVNGDFNSIDGWHDISGYATLVERLIDGRSDV